MRPTLSQYAAALSELAGHEPAKELADKLVAFLGRRGESRKLPGILRELERQDAEREGRLAVTVTTATEAEPDAKKLLAAQAAKLFPGRKHELAFAVDRSLLGGATFRTEDVLYDASLAADVNALGRALSKD